MSLTSYPFDTVSTFRRGGAKRKGTQLTLMVCGRSGLGKSTFLNTLCNGSIYDLQQDKYTPPETLEIIEHTTSIAAPNGKSINLTVIDTPGFGTPLDCTDQGAKLRAYIEERYDEVLRQETKIDRRKFIHDSRVHVCLYFIANSGQGLSRLDINIMTQLAPVVNIVPIIAKSDSFTVRELAEMKSKVREDIDREMIQVFDFGFDLDEDDDDHVENLLEVRKMIPFAVCSGGSPAADPNAASPGRVYPWGAAHSDDSDLGILRDVVFGQYMQDLKESTLGHYEVYRTKVLTENRVGSVAGSLHESTTSGIGATNASIEDTFVTASGASVMAAGSSLESVNYESSMSRQDSGRTVEV